MAQYPRFAMFALALLLIPACGGDDSGGSDADAGTLPPGQCNGDGDCSGGQVCQPVTKTCEDPGPACTEQSECTGGAYCETSSGFCLPSSVGTPCAGPDNCSGECVAGVCGCTGVNNERQLEAAPLDIFFMLDRTGSMGTDCSYTAGNSPPVSSKACYATYALADYLIEVDPAVETRLALDDMSHANDCTGTEHDDPEVGFTRLPVTAGSALVQDISNENFSGGYGTQIEGALRGISLFTAANQTDGREIIGVLLTDGQADGCNEVTDDLAQIVSDHRTATGIRTFIIGMTGADEAVLEALAIAGGAEPHTDYCGGITPPCHYYNVGDGDGEALAQALQAISQQAVDLPCSVDVSTLQAPEGEELDYSLVNVTFSDGGSTTSIGQVGEASACGSETAWYYDDNVTPTTIELCPAACTAVGEAGDGANLNVVAGCSGTFIIE